jgi:hypothetical protein
MLSSREKEKTTHLTAETKPGAASDVCCASLK